jgi:hypothetical protein
VLKAASEKLIQESHALAEHMYKQASSAQGGGASGEETPPGDGKAPEGDVVDAEYEDPAKK